MGGFTIIAIIIVVVVFILCREFFCWYFKINKHLQIMEKQNKLLTELCRKMGCNETSLSQINDDGFRKEMTDAKYNKSTGDLIEKFNSLPDGEERRSIAYELVELGETGYKKYLQ